MGTNQEHGKLSAKAPAGDEVGQQAVAPATRTEAVCETSEDMIRVLNSAAEDSVESTVEDLPRLDPKVRAHLGRLVRTTYAALVDEPVPERFLKLLEELERSEECN